MNYTIKIKEGNEQISLEYFNNYCSWFFNKKFPAFQGVEFEDFRNNAFIAFQKHMLHKEFDTKKHFLDSLCLRLKQIKQRTYCQSIGISDYFLIRKGQKKSLSLERLEEDGFELKETYEISDFKIEKTLIALNFIKLKYAYPFYYNMLGISQAVIAKYYKVNVSTVYRDIQEASKQLAKIFNETNPVYFKEIKDAGLPLNGKRFIFLSKEKALKKIKTSTSMKVYTKKYYDKQSEEYKKGRHRKRNLKLNKKQRIAGLLRFPNRQRVYNKRHKEAQKKHDKKRAKTQKRLDWKKEYHKKPEVRERHRMMYLIKHYRQKLDGTHPKGGYQTPRAIAKGKKKLEMLLQLYGPDRRFKQSKYF